MGTWYERNKEEAYRRSREIAKANRMKWDTTPEELEIFCRGSLALGQGDS